MSSFSLNCAVIYQIDIRSIQMRQWSRIPVVPNIWTTEPFVVHTEGFVFTTGSLLLLLVLRNYYFYYFYYPGSCDGLILFYMKSCE